MEDEPLRLGAARYVLSLRIVKDFGVSMVAHYQKMLIFAA